MPYDKKMFVYNINMKDGNEHVVQAEAIWIDDARNLTLFANRIPVFSAQSGEWSTFKLEGRNG